MSKSHPDTVMYGSDIDESFIDRLHWDIIDSLGLDKETIQVLKDVKR